MKTTHNTRPVSDFNPWFFAAMLTNLYHNYPLRMREFLDLFTEGGEL